MLKRPLIMYKLPSKIEFYVGLYVFYILKHLTLQNMNSVSSVFLVIILGMFISCSPDNRNQKLVYENVSFASNQYDLMISKILDSQEVLFPKSFDQGKMVYIGSEEWTSGFFPGSLWYIYELTGDEKWKSHAIKYTEILEPIQFFTRNHDVGFMIFCSYGNGYRLTENEVYKDVIINAAKSLSTRFVSEAGIIRSWSWSPKDKNWECPVIIDNLMNLELLFEVTKLTGDSTFYNIAVSHADKTIENHFRPDYSTWHVIDYSKSDGSVKQRHTQQGYSDDSTWARGQAWAVYGYTMCYRETGNEKYLKQAEEVLEYVINHPNYPEDGVPYWDFASPGIPDTYKDASSGSILASALYEISMYSTRRDYKAWADKIIISLSEKYRAVLGENGHFILMHSVGSLPENNEVDVPLNYADYYFLEALKRKSDIEK